MACPPRHVLEGAEPPQALYVRGLRLRVAYPFYFTAIAARPDRCASLGHGPQR